MPRVEEEGQVELLTENEITRVVLRVWTGMPLLIWFDLNSQRTFVKEATGVKEMNDGKTTVTVKDGKQLEFVKIQTEEELAEALKKLKEHNPNIPDFSTIEELRMFVLTAYKNHE